MEAASRLKEPEETPKKGTPKKKAMKPGWDEQLTEPDKRTEHPKKAAAGQLPSPSKQKAASLAPLTRAPISQSKKKQAFPPVSTVFQESQKRQPVPRVVKPPPPG